MKHNRIPEVTVCSEDPLGHKKDRSCQCAVLFPGIREGTGSSQGLQAGVPAFCSVMSETEQSLSHAIAFFALLVHLFVLQRPAKAWPDPPPRSSRSPL